jgi:hypothetical protein
MDSHNQESTFTTAAGTEQAVVAGVGVLDALP